MPRVGIVGGGAAGMTAAITAARNGAKVTVFEHTAKPGKKILSTGNGRCNLTNERISAENYHGDPKFALAVLREFGLRDTLDFFESIGIHPVKNQDGYYYPRSMQAASVNRALISETERLGAEILCQTAVSRIRGSGGGFVLESDRGCFTVDRLILACGGQAAPATGSDGSGYQLAADMGLSVVPPAPALVPLTSSWKGFKELNGIRAKGRITLLIDGNRTASEYGELQLCDYGLSGIAVFQVSRHVSRALKSGKKVAAELDFFEEYTPKELAGYLHRQALNRGYVRCGDFLTGLLPEKLGLQLLKQSKISRDLPAGQLSDGQIRALAEKGKSFTVPITGTLGFDRAQVCAGGVDTKELNPTTMECKRCPGLYLAGELINVDGVCGGYNLQFAWSSGYLAGQRAARE